MVAVKSRTGTILCRHTGESVVCLFVCVYLKTSAFAVQLLISISQRFICSWCLLQITKIMIAVSDDDISALMSGKNEMKGTLVKLTLPAAWK